MVPCKSGAEIKSISSAAEVFFNVKTCGINREKASGFSAHHVDKREQKLSEACHASAMPCAINALLKPTGRLLTPCSTARLNFLPPPSLN